VGARLAEIGEDRRTCDQLTCKFFACSCIWWCEMESDSEDSSEFSGQWTDRWSTGSEAVKCETLGTESEQPEEESSRVADDAKAQESSTVTVMSNEEPNSFNPFVAG
ncbi:hypothetical protein S245_051041, partial [Arachis hypogaea]